MESIISYTPVNYNLLKIKPDRSLSGNVYSNIIKSIFSTRKPIKERVEQTPISKLNANVRVHMNNPITYEIMFDGDDKKTTPIFSFGIPEDCTTYMKQRIQGILPQSTLTFEEDYADNFSNAYVVEYNYVKDSMLSLKVTENNFLQAMLSLKNDIQSGEKILFQVEMLPISDMWKSFQDDKWDKMRNGKDVATKKGAIDKTIDSAHKELLNILNLADMVVGYDSPKKSSKSEDAKDKKERGASSVSTYSSASKGKKNDDGFSVRIRAYIICKGKMVAKSYATTIETAMRELEEDNRLVMGNMKQGNVKRGLSVKSMIPVGRNIMSGKELASIVNIPNQKLQREFKIDSINTRQISAPKECRDNSSGIRIGTMEIFAERMEIFYPSLRDILAMPRWLLCGMGGGKTTALLNQAIDIMKAKQGLIDINYTSKCELAYALKDVDSKHVIINFADINNIPSFMFPEVKILSTDTAHDRKRKAGNCGNEIEYFINCVTADGGEKFTPRMGQYLICAAKIVFIYNGMKVKTVFDIIEDGDIRDEWINKAIQSGVYKEDDYEIRKLRVLDDDTKGSLTSGISDRFSILMRDSTIQTMLESDNPMFDFIDIMDNGKTISLCMPEDDFTNKKTKDVIIAYLMCRIRLAMLARKDRTRVCHVFFDEAHHLDSSLNIISHSVAEVRKYGIALCFATHYFAQLGESLKKAALSVNGHFILIKGIGEISFNELKSKLGEEWVYEDMKELPSRSTLNMIFIDQEYRIFASQMLPPPVDKNGNLYIA